MVDHRKSIDRLRERCRTETEISDADGEAILEFSDQIELLGSKYTDARHEFHLMRLVKIASTVGGLAAALEDREAAEDIVRWIHQEYDNPETNHDYRIALRMFGEHLHDGEDKPDSIEWVPAGYESTYDPAPDPSNMLHWQEHILPMVDACYNNRDRALITLAWDLGPRPGELLPLKVGSLVDSDFGMKATVQGKRGRRSPNIIPSVPYVQRWLSDHPGDGSSDAPMWSRLHENKQISHKMMSKAIKEAASRAGVDRPVTPTNFRKSSAAYLASQNVSQAHIENHHGWKHGSRIAARYITVFGEQSAREVARAHGVDVSSKETPATAPVPCPRCANDTPRHEPTCVHCGQPMNPRGSEALEAAQQAIGDDMVSTDESKLRSAAKDAMTEMFADKEFMASTVARYMSSHSSGSSP